MTSLGVLGATGLVGRAMLRVLEQRAFPLERLVPLASEAGAARDVPFRGRAHPVEPASPDALAGLDLVLCAASAEVARRLVPEALSRGARVVDNSSAFRLDPGVPLVVPEVNGALLAERPRLVANPNCSTIQLVCVLAPLERAAGLASVRVASYQSVSGAGAAALAALDAGRGALDVVPLIGPRDRTGRSEEEAKVRAETQKILGRALDVEALCARVPVRVGHGEAVWVTTERPLSCEEARRLLAEAPGVACDGEDFTTPAAAAGGDLVHVGRLRSIAANGLSFWIVADNLRKGAALNAVQIAEALSAPR